MAGPDELGHGASPVGDNGGAAGERLDDAEPERLVVRIRVLGCGGGAEPGRPVGAVDDAEVDDVAAEAWLDFLVEVVVVLDDPSDAQSTICGARELDRGVGALVGMDPPEEQ